jgi:CRISPR/Cas system CSM-associated protein Csm3 (group 7 of RAMP superfamily)
MKLIRIKTIKGKIKVETGLHIGAGNDAIEIGVWITQSSVIR